MEYLGINKVINGIDPRVSVCVMTYNHVSFIKECLDGILMQETDFPFEIVLGEDESSDGTREICVTYAEKYPDKIRLFLRRREDVIYINGNATGRFNMIENLKAAKGKYIALCEGDDYWIDPLKLQKQYDLAVSHKLDAVFGRTYHLRGNAKNEVKDDYFEKGKIDLLNVPKEHWLFGHTSSYFVKSENIKDALNDYLLMEAAGGNNVVFYHAIKKNNVGFIQDFLSVYRHHSGGVSKESRSSTEWDLHTFNKYNVYSNLYARSKVLRASLAFNKNYEGASLLHTNLISNKEKSAVIFYALRTIDKNLKKRLKKSFKKIAKQILGKN